MSVKYDIERFLADVKSFLQSGFNTAIVAMNAEKNDAVVLGQIDSAAYFLQTLNDKVVNYSPFIFYGEGNVIAEGIGPATRKQYSVDVVLVLVDNAEAQDAVPVKLFRYRRILEELFENNWATMKSSVKLKIQSLSPIAFNLVNSSADYRAIGITLDFTLS